MKKILFLVKKLDGFQKELYIAAAEKISTTIVVKEITEVVINLSKKNEIYIGDYNILEFDLVAIRTVGVYIEEVTVISEYCATHNIPVTDSVFTFTKPWIDRKSFEYQRLLAHNLPIIPSYFVSERSLVKIQDTLQFPVIAKITNGSQGKGVYKCNSLQEINDVFTTEKQPLLIQKYIQNDGDLRVLVIGSTVLGGIKRMSSNTDEFRNNVSLGGAAQIHELTDTQAQLALQAAQALQYEIAGVDIIADTNGDLFIMEVNRAPQFTGFMEATKIDVPLKIVEFLASKCK